jgi:hypothetical protein
MRRKGSRAKRGKDKGKEKTYANSGRGAEKTVVREV